jgi:hypothetical protein
LSVGVLIYLHAPFPLVREAQITIQIEM